MSYLDISFIDVGHGDCIAITFPNGKIGIVDCNVNAKGKIPELLANIINNKSEIEFICLTHPHLDHYRGMFNLISKSSCKINEFWHSMSEALLRSMMEFINTRSVFDEDEDLSLGDIQIKSKKYDELLDIFAWIKKNQKKIKNNGLISEFKHLRSFSGVDIYSLSPSSDFLEKYQEKLLKALLPDASCETIDDAVAFANHISIVLLLRYGKNNIILGGDALATNWKQIVNGLKNRPGYFSYCHCIKASHHGAKNSFFNDMWPFFLKDGSKIVISAGDSLHPSQEFLNSVSKRWPIFCTGRRNSCDRYIGESGNFSSLSFLDDISYKAKANKCFGDITFRFEMDKEGPILIKTESTPNESSIICR